MLELIEATASAVTVAVDGAAVTLSHRWIRDHSEDPVSLDQITLQREVDTFAIPAHPAALRAEIVDDVLEVAWVDGAPTSRCSLALLRSVAGPDPGPRQRLWNRPEELEVAPLPCPDVLGDDAALAALLDDLARWGVGLVTGMRADPVAAGVLAERIGRVRTTTFGGMWALSSDLSDHLDSAYATTHLEPHTDGTYLGDAPATQLFCCVERTGTGGESILVDGFAAVAALEAAHPGHVETLRQLAVPARYVEPGVDLRAARPAIRHDHTGRLAQVSFNNYDRAPFWLPEPHMRAFYDAYSALHDLVVDRSRWFERRLEPGDALIFDNWRVLHGRRAFTGTRVFHGCYHDRDEIESRRRTVAGSVAHEHDRPGR